MLQGYRIANRVSPVFQPRTYGPTPRIAPRFAATVCLAFSLLAQASPAECGWRSFTTRDGLAVNDVNCVMEDRSGNLWFGTDNSYAMRYDGSTWQTFPVPQVGPYPAILSILEDRAGNLWFGTVSGVRRFDGSSWVNHLDGLNVEDMIQDRSGTIWFATNAGIWSHDSPSYWNTYTTADGLYDDGARNIVEDHNGIIWAATGWGVNRFDGYSWSRNLAMTGLSDLLVDRAGHVWASSTDHGVSFFDGSSPWRTFTTADGLVSDQVNSIAEDRRGALWFGTSGYGVSRYDGARWRTYTRADGLASNYVSQMFTDRDGNLWMGAYSDGVSRYDHSGWRTYTIGDGLGNDRTLGLLQARDRDIWALTDATGANRYDGLSWRNITQADGAPSDTIYYVAEDHSGNLWFQTGQRGVARFDGTNWQHFTTGDGLASDRVNRIFTDHGGNVWVASIEPTGISRYDGSAWRGFKRPEYIGGQVTCHFVDRAGNVWVGSRLGVSRFDGLTWRTFTTADGLPESNHVVSIYEDRNGAMWFGSPDAVTRFDGSGWQRFTVADGFVGQHVYSILEDGAGSLWFASYAGATRFNGSTWHTFAVGNALYPTTNIMKDDDGNLWFATQGAGVARFDGSLWRTFTAVDGLANNFTECSLKDHEGSIWYGTVDGLSRYEPDRIPPRTVFRAAPPNLSASRTALARFAAFGEPEGIEFSYRLDGGAWSDWSSQGEWIGFGLADGSHRLQVRSRDFVANVDSTPADTTFEVDATPPMAVIAYPAFGQAVRGIVEIDGAATDTRFDSYHLMARPTGAESWDPPDAKLIVQSTIPAAAGSLGFWNTSDVTDGVYELRLTVNDNLGLVGTDLATVVVDNQFPSADETSPRKVLSATGGDLYTTHRELHFYFPPRAFEADVFVTIDTASAPDSLPGSVARVLPAYEVAWSGAPLHKPATLEFSTTGMAPAPGTLAVYTSRDGSAWQRLGGTVEEGKISLAIREAGRYALFAETTPVQGDGTLSALSFTPRVFSTSDRFANDHVAIGFTLGRSAPVTVRIYNRAGRLVREVTSDRVMEAGGNLVRWDGRDRGNRTVSDGLYIVTVAALGQTQRSAIAVVK